MKEVDVPHLVDIMEVAEALESKSVFVAADRCVAVRNRHSSCQKCVDACPADAVSVAKNVVSIDGSACVACGACTTVCPTEALIPLDPLDEDLAVSIANATLAAEGTSVFACARMAARRLGDPDKFAAVPCLARMEESVLVGLAAQGVKDVVLVDGNCATCKYRACSPGIDTTVESANTLLAAQGSKVRVRRDSAFPQAVLAEDRSKSFAASRRGFFTQAGSTARSAAKTAAEKTVAKALATDANQKKPTLRDRLRMSEDGTLPQFNAERRLHVLDSMDALGQSVMPQIETRLFGSVSVDTQVCSSCGMCTVFCPTGALVKSEEKPADSEGSLLEFSAADCVQCNLCADACLKKCLQVLPVVSTEELFDFEPRFIHLPKPPAKKGMISSMRR